MPIDRRSLSPRRRDLCGSDAEDRRRFSTFNDAKTSLLRRCRAASRAPAQIGAAQLRRTLETKANRLTLDIHALPGTAATPRTEPHTYRGGTMRPTSGTGQSGAPRRLGELISGYRVCPQDCDMFEPFEMKTASEVLRHRACLKCREPLECVSIQEIIFWR